MITRIDKEKLNDLIKSFYNITGIKVAVYDSEFTEILLEANIDPTIYLGYIPVGYLRNSSIKYYQIPKWVTKIEAHAFEDS